MVMVDERFLYGSIGNTQVGQASSIIHSEAYPEMLRYIILLQPKAWSNHADEPIGYLCFWKKDRSLMNATQNFRDLQE